MTWLLSHCCFKISVSRQPHQKDGVKGLNLFVLNVPWCSWNHLKIHKVVHRENKQTKQMNFQPLVKELEVHFLIIDPWGWGETGEGPGEQNLRGRSLWDHSSTLDRLWEQGSPYSPPNARNAKKGNRWRQITGSFPQHPSLPNTHSISFVRSTRSSQTAKS